MRFGIILSAFVSMMLFAGPFTALADGPDNLTGIEREALDLYGRGMFSRARALFEQAPDNARNRAYALLCAVRVQDPDYQQRLYEFRRDYGTSILDSQLSFYHALNLFDEGRYAYAGAEFAKVNLKDMDPDCGPELLFKQGYCCYASGDRAGARKFFAKLEEGGVSTYAGECRFLSGQMCYAEGDFDKAEHWFELAKEDPEFAPIASYYVLECEFLKKNYSFVTENGPAVIASAEGERRARAARMVSESFLVSGDKDAAKQYFNEYAESASSMTRADYFYAASIYYSTGDWQAAIDNYLKMGDRSDSLGQVASYNMANSYINTRNRVAAMECFKSASQLPYMPDLQEDAWFNYAKLAFDLNKNAEGFRSYIDKYSTRVRGEQIYSYMALSALYDKDYEAAVSAYDNIDELDADQKRNYVKANYLRACQLVAGGSWRKAAGYFRAVSYYLPKNDRLAQLSRYWMAECQYRGGNWPEARKLFTDLYNTSALSGEPEGRSLPYDVAYCYLKEGEWAQASKWLDIYIYDRHKKFREDALVRRADCDFERKGYKSAVDSYQAVLDEYYSPDKIYPYYRQAMAYGLAGDKNQKAAVLGNVRSASPSAPLYDEALFELASTYSELGKYKEAVKCFEELCSKSQDSTFVARGWLGMGTAYRNAGDEAKALEYFKTVVRKRPGTEYAETALMAVESIYRGRRQPEKYLEFVENEKTLAEKTDKAQMYFNTAEQVFLNGNYEQAAKLFNKYITDYPEGESVAPAWFYLAECDRQAGQKEDACDSYARAISMAPKASFAENARVNYAALLYSLERYQEAFNVYSDLEEEARFDENRAVARLGKLRSSYKARNYGKAVEAADKALADADSKPEVVREINYIKAKSLLALDSRKEAFEIFNKLCSEPKTPQGAESEYLIIQNMYDSGELQGIADRVYAFADSSAGEQSYWLARAYVVLGDCFAAQGKNDFARAIYESILEGYESGSEDGLTDMVRRKLAEL